MMMMMMMTTRDQIPFPAFHLRTIQGFHLKTNVLLTIRGISNGEK